MEGGLPFEVRQPRYNAETEAAIREARGIMNRSVPAERYDSAAAMFAALEEQLEEHYRDHALVGRYAGFRECHIRPDWLLIMLIAYTLNAR